VRIERLLPALALLLLVALVTASAWQWRAGAPLNASVLALLPQQTHDRLVQQAEARMAEPLNRELLLLVGHADRSIALSQIQALAERWASEPAFEQVQWRFAGDPQALRQTLRRHRLGLLSAQDRQVLLDTPERFIAERAADLFDPFSNAVLPLQQDWLGLGQRAQRALADRARLEPDLASGALIRDDDHGLHWALLRARTREDAFHLHAAPAIAALVADARTRLDAAGGQLLATSGVLHAAAGQAQARREILMIGSAAVIGIVLLLLFSFRRLRVLLALLPVGVAVLAGTCACVAVFGQINALTLVLGASLIGVAVDAPLHYLSKSWGGRWQSWQALKATAPGLGLSLASNLIGYLALAFTPFPALTQIALFSVAGLLAAWLCAVCLLPACFQTLHLAPPPALLALCTGLLGWRTRLLQNIGQWPLVVLLLIAIGGGLWQVNVDNDPRQWLGRTPQLQIEAQKIAALTGEQPTSQFFLVRAANEAQLLERQAALAQQLDHLLLPADAEHTRGLRGYRSLTQWIPAPSQQIALNKALRRLPEHWQPLLDAGVPETALQAELDHLLDTPTLAIADALANPLAEPWRILWLGPTGHGVAGLVSLQGQVDRATLQAVAAPLAGVQLVDRLGELDTLFAATQWSAAELKLLACLAIVLLLWRPFGLGGAVRVISLPLLAALAALAGLGWLGQPLTLFSLFGLLLMTAIGVDYAILMRENIGGPAVSLLGTVLAALTSWLSFGLLLLSETPVIANFGLTITLGLLFSFLLAPWASPAPKESHA